MSRAGPPKAYDAYPVRTGSVLLGIVWDVFSGSFTFVTSILVRSARLSALLWHTGVDTLWKHDAKSMFFPMYLFIVNRSTVLWHCYSPKKDYYAERWVSTVCSECSSVEIQGFGYVYVILIYPTYMITTRGEILQVTG